MLGESAEERVDGIVKNIEHMSYSSREVLNYTLDFLLCDLSQSESRLFRHKKVELLEFYEPGMTIG